ncbi:MAG: DUF4091 domain-containing protein [Clostridia bacterium]|nr:DUF4091 domain-containing protein [Clostridia bacterium]
MPCIEMKLMSSMEKCFLDERLESKPETKSFMMFRNERLSFQVGVSRNDPEQVARIRVALSGALADYVTVQRVVHIPSVFPYNPKLVDEDYLRYTPGVYPDLIAPLHYRESIFLPCGQLHTFWLNLSLPEDVRAGEYDLTVNLISVDPSSEKGEIIGAETASIRVLAAELPPQKLIRTEWFYTDCLANYYGVRAFSEKHWKVIDSFIKKAVEGGINMILTPVFTPELDTYIGGERMTTQLVDITVESDGSYTFGFEKLNRWIDLCLDAGVEYFEIPHFFTQWGAKHAPKFVAKVGGRTKRIFGWETDALGAEYRSFLGQLIPALLDAFRAKGVDKRCYFHVSDEPSLAHLEHYKACKELIGQYLEGYPIIDALSNYEFYSTGALKKPVPATKKIEPFLEHKIEGLWAYYCGASGSKDVSNRFFSLSQARVRIIGVQLWLYHIEGFLHWGYNFYNNRYSYDAVNPFAVSDGEGFAPSGDTYLVYPGDDGTAWESLRFCALKESMDDIRALELCESLYGREFTERLVLEGTDGTLTFSHYPRTADYLIDLRRKVALAIDRKS